MQKKAKIGSIVQYRAVVLVVLVWFFVGGVKLKKKLSEKTVNIYDVDVDTDVVAVDRISGRFHVFEFSHNILIQVSNIGIWPSL